MGKAPRVIYKGESKPNSWCRWSVFRVKRRNNSTNIRFVGDTGTGKSFSALAFAEICAEMMGKKFTEKNIYFSLRHVLDEVANNNPPPSTLFFIDENQIEADSDSHQSKRAKAYKAFLSTVRSRRYIIITTLPFADMELKKVRRFFHLEIETHGANLSANTVKLTPRYLEYSRAKKDKVYRKRLIVTFKDEKTGMIKSRKLSSWDIRKPSKEILNIYEPLKEKFQTQLYKKLSKELAAEEGEKDEMPKAAAEQQVLQTLTEYQFAMYELMVEGLKGQTLNEKLKERGFYSDNSKMSVNRKSMIKKGVILVKR